MANVLKPKRSNVAGNIPTTTNLASGEMGVNMADRKVWINNGTSVVQIGAGRLSGLADVVLSSLATGQGLSWNGTNWVNSSAGSGTVTSVSGTGTVSGLTLTGSVTGSGSLTLGGTLSLTSGQVTTALGFTPYNATNPSGYITGSGNAATATALQTARTINGVSFNGTANITVADATKLPLSGGTLTGPLIFGNATSPNTQTIQFGDNTGWTLRYMTSVSGTPTERFRFVDTGAFNAVGAITQNGNQVLHAGNFSSYAPSLSSTYADPAWISSLASSKLTGTIDNARLNGGTYTINVTGNAGSVAWTNVSGRPTAVSSFTNDSGYITSSGTAARLTNFTSTTTTSAGTDNAESCTSYIGSISLFGQTDGALYSHVYSASWKHNIFGDYRTGQLAIRGKNSGTWQAWRTVLDSSNYTSYSPSLTGSGASGTWGINITGNAGSLQGYQWNSSGKDIRGSDIYADSWLRNYNSGTGLYNQATGNHWYSDGQYWNVGYGGTTGIRLRNGHAGTILGYLYAETSGNFGLLHNGGGWAVQVYPGGGGYLHGTWNGANIRATRANGNLYIDDNYGCGIVGAYASTRYQGVFAMGDSYKLPADGTTTGSLYGMAWSHPNAGGVAGNLDSHGMIVMINGGFGSCMSYSIKASGNVTAYSDERLKTNWRDMPENFVARLARVKVGIYDRVDGEKITQVGVSAQSLQQLLPQSITTANDEMGTLSVSYGNAALASAVELAKDNVDLRARVAKLEALVSKLIEG